MTSSSIVDLIIDEYNAVKIFLCGLLSELFERDHWAKVMFGTVI